MDEAFTKEQLDRHLFDACNMGRVSAVETFISQGADVNATHRISAAETELRPLLWTMMQAGSRTEGGFFRPYHLKIIELLLDAGADLDAICHPYHNIAVTARQHAKESDPEIFALIESWDIGSGLGRGKPGARRSIDD